MQVPLGFEVFKGLNFLSYDKINWDLASDHESVRSNTKDEDIFTSMSIDIGKSIRRDLGWKYLISTGFSASTYRIFLLVA
jgi:hypothetical protein